MRKIDEQMIAAIKDARAWKCDNTQVTVTLDSGVVQGIHVYLHNHKIAECQGSAEYGVWRFTLAGYNTKVTRRRVDALCSVFGGPERRGVYTKAGQLYVKRYAALVRDPMGKDTPIADNEWF